ncbi:hypothetical protein AcV5_002864 [Taiwanofungus camphoratus]|nr:hypothetical protein AcV5_002864 [Antrodia cinnamomea]
MEGAFVLRYRAFSVTSQAGAGAPPVLAECVGGPFRVFSIKAFPGLRASTDLTKVSCVRALHSLSRSLAPARPHTASSSPSPSPVPLPLPLPFPFSPLFPPPSSLFPLPSPLFPSSPLPLFPFPLFLLPLPFCGDPALLDGHGGARARAEAEAEAAGVCGAEAEPGPGERPGWWWGWGSVWGREQR